MTPSRFIRPRAARTAAPLAESDRPVLAPGVAFEEGATDQTAWMVTLHGVPSSRVSRAVVDLLTAMDGDTSLHDLHARFAASEPREVFLQLVQRFQVCGLLVGVARRAPGRVSYRPPFTLQLATLHAPAIFSRLDRATVTLSRRTALTCLVVLLCLGGLAAALQAAELVEVLVAPMPLAGLVSLVVVLSLITVIHECAHGVSLTRFGGSPRRAGFMLFYLTPAFFVDVTDGWRLPDRRQRVVIALAGPAAHAVIGAMSLSAALVVPQQPAHQTLLLLGVACAAIVLLNLIPFVRFDGYIALMSALDEPNLRNRTIRDGANFVRRLLFGGPREHRAMHAWWSVPFGLASLITPVVLVLFAVARINRALAGGGPVLGLLVVLLEAAVVLVGVGLLAKAVRGVLRAGVSRLRLVSVGAAVVAVIATAGFVIPVPESDILGFVRQDDRVVLVRGGEATGLDMPEHAPIVLMSNGILANEHIGEATARPRPPVDATVPLEALFPVTAGDMTIAATVVGEADVVAVRRGMPETGLARIELGARSLWHTLWAMGVESPLSALRSDKEKEE